MILYTWHRQHMTLTQVGEITDETSTHWIVSHRRIPKTPDPRFAVFITREPLNVADAQRHVETALTRINDDIERQRAALAATEKHRREIAATCIERIFQCRS